MGKELTPYDVGYIEAKVHNARRDAFEEAARIAESEPEPEGEPPSPMHLLTLRDACCATVRATRNAIALRIREARDAQSMVTLKETRDE